MIVELVRENQKKIKLEQEINKKEKDFPYWHYLNNELAIEPDKILCYYSASHQQE